MWQTGGEIRWEEGAKQILPLGKKGKGPAGKERKWDERRV